MSPSIGQHYEAYMTNPSHENEAVLCKGVYSEINPDLLEFMHEYQQYLNRKDVHELFDQLSRSITDPVSRIERRKMVDEYIREGEMWYVWCGKNVH